MSGRTRLLVRRSVRDIRTVASLRDGRRRRTAHGAYMELAALAMQKERLLKERQVAAGRNEDIDGRIREMEHQSALLLASIESHDRQIRQGIEGPGEPSGPTRAMTGKADTNRSQSSTIRERTLGY